MAWIAGKGRSRPGSSPGSWDLGHEAAQLEGSWWLCATLAPETRREFVLDSGQLSCTPLDTRVSIEMDLRSRSGKTSRLRGYADLHPDRRGLYRWKRRRLRLSARMAGWEYEVAPDGRLLAIRYPGSMLWQAVSLVFARNPVSRADVVALIERHRDVLGLPPEQARDVIYLDRPRHDGDTHRGESASRS